MDNIEHFKIKAAGNMFVVFQGSSDGWLVTDATAEQCADVFEFILEEEDDDEAVTVTSTTVVVTYDSDRESTTD
jgi:hypothetical protein